MVVLVTFGQDFLLRWVNDESEKSGGRRAMHTSRAPQNINHGTKTNIATDYSGSRLSRVTFRRLPEGSTETIFYLPLHPCPYFVRTEQSCCYCCCDIRSTCQQQTHTIHQQRTNRAAITRGSVTAILRNNTVLLNAPWAT